MDSNNHFNIVFFKIWVSQMNINEMQSSLVLLQSWVQIIVYIVFKLYYCYALYYSKVQQMLNDGSGITSQQE